MTPREVVAAYLQRICDLSDHPNPASEIGGSAQESAQILIDALKAEGFFIGPLKATPTMLGAASSYRSVQTDLRYHWEEMIEEWQRSEGQ